MKSKIILGILVALAAGSSAMNIYQYNLQNELNHNLQSLQSEYNNLSEQKNSLDSELLKMEDEVSAIQKEIGNLEEIIKSQQLENEALLEQIDSLSAEAESIISEPVVIEEKPAPVEPQVTDPTSQGNNGLINPNTGAPLQPGDSGVTNGFEWEYVGDDTGLF